MDFWLCDMFRKLLSFCAYLPIVQASYVRRWLHGKFIAYFLLFSFVQAQFWHDPVHEDRYKLGSAFLSDINQEIVSVFETKLRAKLADKLDCT